MQYIVNWPKAAFYDARKGKDKVVLKGGRVPEFVDDRTVAHLARVGAVVAIEDAPAAAPGGSASATDGPPTKRDDVATWTAYAASVGLAEEDLKGLKKPELIAAVLAKAGVVDPDPVDTGEGAGASPASPST